METNPGLPGRSRCRVVKSLVGVILAFLLAWPQQGLSGQGRMGPDLEGLPDLSAAVQVDPDASGSQSFGRRVARAVAAGALGAAIGFFASQVAQGDWDEQSGGEKIDRSKWAAVGGGGGFLIGLSIPLFGHAPGGEPSVRESGAQFSISGAEIRGASVGNALEAVRLFHPEWLVQRGRQSFGDPSSDIIKIYLDNIQLGGLDDLAGVSSSIIELIRYLDARQATARWGAGHGHGAIQVITFE